MSTDVLNGKTLKNMLLGGVQNMRSSSSEINDLNVFPVPDGDTGTNMTMTLEGGIAEISEIDNDSIGDIITRFARGALLGARGNSGVILSQILAGIKDSLAEKDTVTALDLAAAYRGGVEKSYSAVRNPTEGTILTVFRESTEFAARNVDENSTIDDFYRLHIEEAHRSLERTKELLPVLAEADVVDSGGAGYLAIAVGMYLSLTGKLKSSVYRELAPKKETPPDIERFTRYSKLEFGYCTEFLLRLTVDKCDIDAFELGALEDKLTEMGGESIVAYRDGDIVKVHVHTFTPGEVLSYCQGFGEFLTLKIENMSVGHSEEKEAKKKERARLSVLSVATGEGMCSLFLDMGADGIISGGQTQNPSTEEFIEAFRAHDAEHIIVLPNNKNVHLAAKQAAELYTDAEVHIIPTKSLMQGYGALSVITPGITDVDMLVENTRRAAESVIGAEITRAVRSVTINGREIREGDFIAISEGDIVAVAASAETTVLEMLKTVDMDDYEIITLFVGKGISEDTRVELTEKIEEEYPDCEVIVYEGGQEVYDYLVAIE
ncbi:MAG: DAK2 domain-containing protein [Clostridia bacterium]|nr:DAK2 domain-containing protein [Clostridia bacterium]